LVQHGAAWCSVGCYKQNDILCIGANVEIARWFVNDMIFVSEHHLVSIITIARFTACVLVTKIDNLRIRFII